MSKWLILLVVIAATAGCTEPADGADGPTETGGTTNDTSTSGTSTSGTPTSGPGGNDTNAAPLIQFTADRSAGQVPFNVTFSIAGSDADGDMLSWSLLGNGTQVANGTDLPANVTVAITEPGNLTFQATLSDGAQTTNASLQIIATAGEAVYNGPAPVVWSGSAISADRTAVLGCIVYEDPTGEGYLYFDGSYAGLWLYKATGDPTVGSMITEWWAGDSVVDNDAPPAGTIPDGADNVAACSDTPGDPVDFTLTLYHPNDPSVA